MPKRETLKTMWVNNSDGAGYMYTNKQKEVVIKKGFMTVDALLDSLDDLAKKTYRHYSHFMVFQKNSGIK